MAIVSLIASTEALFAAARLYRESLNYQTDTIDQLEARYSVGGNFGWAMADDRTSLAAYFSERDAEGNTISLINIKCPESEARFWQFPLASGELVTVHASRGDLSLPRLHDVTIVAPHNRRYIIAGDQAPVYDEGDDFPPVTPWTPKGPPGAQSGYSIGAITERAGKVWVQGLNLPESSPGALNGGNYFEPGAVGSGWITLFAEAEPMWMADAFYAQPIIVRDFGRDAPTVLHRYELLTATETSLVGREPRQAYMWAVWKDLGE